MWGCIIFILQQLWDAKKTTIISFFGSILFEKIKYKNNLEIIYDKFNKEIFRDEDSRIKVIYKIGVHNKSSKKLHDVCLTLEKGPDVPHPFSLLHSRTKSSSCDLSPNEIAYFQTGKQLYDENSCLNVRLSASSSNSKKISLNILL